MRIDCTVVESNIHAPYDSELLYHKIFRKMPVSEWTLIIMFKDLGNPAAYFVFLSIFSFFIFLSANATVVPLTVSHHNPTDFIIYNEKQVTIDAQNKTLNEVLQAVQSLSDIKFSASEELLDHKINRTVKAADWGKAVKKLLRDFNIFVLWDDDRMVQVFVLNSGGDEKTIGHAFIPSFVEENSSDTEIAKIEPEEDPGHVSLVPPPVDKSGLENEYPEPPDDTLLAGIPEEMAGDLSENDLNSPVNSDPSVNGNEISSGENNDASDSVASQPPSAGLLPPPPQLN